MMKMAGRVYLVGAGPGDPELLTLKAARLISQAEVVVYDRLVSKEILALASPKAETLSVGKSPKRHPVPQDVINELLVKFARSGRLTIRLKGGDPFIFGRGSEEALALRNAGVFCEIVPGITAAQGCAASAGVPLTHRGLATSVRFITGHCRQDLPLDLDWRGMADLSTTLVVYMGASNIAEISLKLSSQGLPLSTPVLAINNGTTPRERRIVSDLGAISEAAKLAHFEGPVLFVIGAVVSLYRSGEMVSAISDVLRAVPLQRELSGYACL